MPTGPTLAPPTQVFPDTPAPKKTRPMQTCAQAQLECLLSRSASVPQTPPPTIRIQSATGHLYDSISTMPQSKDLEDEYTLTAYGDVSLSEIIVPPLPPPTHRGSGPLQPRHPPLRLRLKVRRPPMPRRRPSYTYIPYTEDLDLDERWPGSPRPFADNPWLQHQPLVSLPQVDHTTGNNHAKKSDSSIEKLFDQIIPRSPSIRLSPPGSPAAQALSLPQETHEQKIGAQTGRNASQASGAVNPPRVLAPLAQDKPKETPWRTRLPPRLPIPKWDV